MRRSNFLQSEDVQEILQEIYALFLKSQQPPDRVILDDVDLRNILKISKRKTASLRSEKKITFSKDAGKIYYLLSNVLDYIHVHQVDSIESRMIPMQKSTKRTRA